MRRIPKMKEKESKQIEINQTLETRESYDIEINEN
jgi:hypothetical protein